MKRKDIFAVIIAGSLALTASICPAEDDKAASSAPDADNTALNERDRSSDTLTSGDQANTSEEIKVTAAIRRAIVSDDSLTATAANVKIITADGHVTLRGPVTNADEKSKIQAAAKAVAGDGKVDNQLEVAPPASK